MMKTAAVFLAAGLLAAATGFATAPTAAAGQVPSCRSHDDAYPIGDPPVVSYYCPAPAGAPNPVQLDVYIGTSRNGPNYLPCDQSVLPAQVYTLFCSG